MLYCCLNITKNFITKKNTNVAMKGNVHISIWASLFIYFYLFIYIFAYILKFHNNNNNNNNKKKKKKKKNYSNIQIVLKTINILKH